MPKWLIYSALTVLLWGGWGVVPKALGDSLPPTQIQALSTLGLLPVMLALGFSRNLPRGRNTLRGTAYAFAAGLLVAAGNLAYFKALGKGGKASTVTTVTALYPLVTVITAFLFLKEKLNVVQLLGIGIALSAMYFFNAGEEAVVVSRWLAMVPLTLWGIGALLQKVSAGYISQELSTLCFLAAFVPIAVALLLLETFNWNLTDRDWLMLFGLGLLFGLGNLTLIAAYSNAGKASIVTPLVGLYPVVTVPLAIVFLGEKVSGRELTAIGLALAAVVALSYEKRGNACPRAS